MEIQRRWIWKGAIIIGIAAFILILVFRANPPRERVAQDGPRVFFTSGPFVSGPLTVEAGEYLNFKFVLNAKNRLNGKFATARYRAKIECLVLDETNFELFRKGGEFQKLVSTGPIPGGKIERVLEPGSYFVVFDNRPGVEKVDLPEAEFSIGDQVSTAEVFMPTMSPSRLFPIT